MVYRRHTTPAAAAELDRLARALKAYRKASERAALRLAAQISACLRAGATWGEIGARLGMTRQGARAHWSSFIQDSAEAGSIRSPDEEDL